MNPNCLAMRRRFTGANTIRQGRFEQADGGTRCFWTKLAICRWISRLVCYACWLTDSSTAWAVRR
ncbi:hypothetical protein KCP74_04745 [Salmonella enterica subsp. enterica]|nr:hypothetical protein KCP74_04745 [Salmonella enterica subsp. enterica]